MKDQNEKLLEKIVKLKGRIKRLEGTVKALLSATSDLAFVIDGAGNIQYINDSAARRFGKIPDDLIGANMYNFYSNEEREFRKAYIEVVKFSGQPVQFEEVHRGDIFATCIHPILDEERKINRFAVFFNEITEHKKNEESIYRFSQIFSTVHDPMSFIDRNYIFRTANDAYLNIYGKKKEEVIGRPVQEVFGREVFQDQIKESIDRCMKGEKVHFQDWFSFPRGENRFMYMSYYPLFTKDRKVSGAVVNAVDITKNREMQEKLKHLSVTDQLTGIFNRVRFCDALDEEIKKLLIYGAELSVIMFDIDNFKRINDTYGHDTGDKVIVRLVGIVKSCIRDSDIFARWGGEEFMILVPDADLDIAFNLAERIREKIASRPFEGVGLITCSFGTAQFISGETGDAFTKRADQALYKAKTTGRNKVEAARRPPRKPELDEDIDEIELPLIGT